MEKLYSTSIQKLTDQTSICQQFLLKMKNDPLLPVAKPVNNFYNTENDSLLPVATII